MSTMLPLEDARSVAAHDIPAGTFFCTFESPAGKRGFFLRVDAAGQGDGIDVINLTGEAPYRHESWQGDATRRRSLALPSSRLQLRLDMDEQPASGEGFKPGNLAITANGPLMIVDAGSGKPGYVSFGDGKLMLDRVEPCACFSKWKLLSRNDHGTDTVVMQIGGE